MRPLTTRYCFWLCIVVLLPMQCLAVFCDEWFWLPPKPSGDGPDYETIGYGIYQGLGVSTYFSSTDWKAPYVQADPVRYAKTILLVGPIVPDTSRPPLLPAWIAGVYTVVPRGPYAFAAIRLSFACSLAIGTAIFAVWGFQMFRDSGDAQLASFAPWLPLFMIGIVITERNFRNYLTDFLTEPFAYLGTA